MPSPLHYPNSNLGPASNVWKRQKLPTKRGRSGNDPTPNYDVTRFMNEGAADRFGTICKNRSFIKEKGFHHHDDFFRKTIAANGWRHFANHLT